MYSISAWKGLWSQSGSGGCDQKSVYIWMQSQILKIDNQILSEVEPSTMQQVKEQYISYVLAYKVSDILLSTGMALTRCHPDSGCRWICNHVSKNSGFHICRLTPLPVPEKCKSSEHRHKQWGDFRTYNFGLLGHGMKGGAIRASCVGKNLIGSFFE